MNLNQINLLPKFSPPLNLDRVTRIMKECQLLRPVFPWVHVAGTKGKGSTCVFLNNILVEAGYQVGLYISPHLCDSTERIAIQSIPVKEKELVPLANQLDSSLNRLGIQDISFFEYWTLLALFVFTAHHIDIAIIETGLGGRLDATNAIQNPLLSILTLIGRDHVDRLGSSPEVIALEKAGIIRQSVPVLSAKQIPEVELIITKEAQDHASRHYSLYRDYEISFEKSSGFEPGRMNILSYLSGIAYANLTVTMIGKHQLENAALGLAAAEVLSKKGFCVDETTIRNGIKQAFIPGRIEPIPYQNKLILLDGAHNPDSFKALVETIQERFPGKKFQILFGSLKNKLVQENVEICSAIVRKIWWTKIPGHDSALRESVFLQPEILVSIEFSSPDEALKRMIQEASDGEMLIVTGSLYLAGSIRKLLLPDTAINYRLVKED